MSRVEELERVLAAERTLREELCAMMGQVGQALRDAQNELAKLGIPDRRPGEEDIAMPVAEGIRMLAQQLADEREMRQLAVAAARKYEVVLREAEDALRETGGDADEKGAILTVAGGIRKLWRQLAAEREARQEAEARLYAGCQNCMYEPHNRCADQCEGCTVWEALVRAGIEAGREKTHPNPSERTRWTEISDLVARSEYGE